MPLWTQPPRAIGKTVPPLNVAAYDRALAGSPYVWGNERLAVSDASARTQSIWRHRAMPTN
jgi:hypothetical protein